MDEEPLVTSAVDYWNSLSDARKVGFLEIVEKTLSLEPNSEEAATFAVAIMAYRDNAPSTLEEFVQTVATEIKKIPH